MEVCIDLLEKNVIIFNLNNQLKSFDSIEKYSIFKLAFTLESSLYTLKHPKLKNILNYIR